MNAETIAAIVGAGVTALAFLAAGARAWATFAGDVRELSVVARGLRDEVSTLNATLRDQDRRIDDHGERLADHGARIAHLERGKSGAARGGR